MSNPSKPKIDYSYAGFQAETQDNPFPGTQLDNDLAELETSIDETIDALADIRRSDGALKNSIVTADSLDESLLIGLKTPAVWGTGFRYVILDCVTINEPGLQGVYRCDVSHESADFSDDLGAGYWELIFSLTADALGLAPVAVSGSYTDLIDKPTLGGAAGLDVGTTAGTVAAGDDVRIVKAVRTVEDRAAMKALDTTKVTLAFLIEADRQGAWQWTAGNFSTQVTADTLEGIYVKATAVAASDGAWVRVFDGRVFARWFGSNQAAITAANTMADDITIDRDFPITTTATWPNGKNYLFLGAGNLSIATAVTLTARGIVNSQVWQGLPTTAPKKIFTCTGTGKIIGLRFAKPEWWGAVGDATTDDKVALQAAHDCVEASLTSDGGRPEVELRGGANYGLGSQLTLRPTANINLKFTGAGPIFGGTRFTTLTTFSTSLGAAAIRINGSADSIQRIAAFDVGNFGIIRSTGTALVGLWIGGNGTTTDLIGVQQSPVHDIHVDGFVFGFRAANCRLIDFNRCSAWCQNVASSVGFLVTVDGPTAFTGDLNFNSCQFVADPATSRKCVSIDNRIATAQMKGIRFNNCIFYKGDRYFEIYAANGGLIGDVWINPGCQFDGFGNSCVHIEADGANSVIDSVHIVGTYMRGISASQVAVRVKSTSSGKIRDAHIRGNQIFSLLTGARAIVVEGLIGGSIDENIVTDIDSPSIEAILIDGSSRFTACGNKLNRSGSQAVSWFISFGSGCNYFGYDMNIAGGIATVSAVRDLTATANKLVGQNL